MLDGYGSISSPDHEPLSLLEPAEDQSVVTAQKPRLSSAEQLDAIFQKIDENRNGRISKEELIAVHHECHADGDGRLPAQEPGGCLPGIEGAFGAGVAPCSSRKLQLQASAVVPLPEVICCDTGGTENRNVETIVTNVGGASSSVEDGAATAVGGNSFDVCPVKESGHGATIVADGGSAKHSVLMWVRLNFDILWQLLIRGTSLVKAGSFALCLLSFFIDKQLSFSSKDTLYLRIAFVCGLSAFFVASWHVPNASTTRRAQDMQEISVLTLLMGVLTVMVTALDKEFRVPVLISCLALIHFGRDLEDD